MKIGLFCGKFAPPHRGHFNAAKIAAEENNKVIIYVSPLECEGINVEQKKQIWNLYLEALPIHVSLLVSEHSPVRAVYEQIDYLNKLSFADKFDVTLYCDEEEMSRFDRVNQYSDKLHSITKKPTPRLTSATEFRKAIKTGVKENIKPFIPSVISIDDVWNVLNAVHEDKKAAP